MIGQTLDKHWTNIAQTLQKHGPNRLKENKLTNIYFTSFHYYCKVKKDDEITTVKKWRELLTFISKQTRLIMASLIVISVYDRDLSSSKLTIILRPLKLIIISQLLTWYTTLQCAQSNWLQLKRVKIGTDLKRAKFTQILFKGNVTLTSVEMALDKWLCS